jgi:hypothetical protein
MEAANACHLVSKPSGVGASEKARTHGTQSAVAELLPPAATNRHCAMGEMSVTSAAYDSGEKKKERRGSADTV